MKLTKLRRLGCCLAATLTGWAFGVAAEGLTDYEQPGFTQGRDYLNHSFAEFVDPFTGNLHLHHQDLVLPGNGGFDLKVSRTYNANNAWQQLSPFGRGWDIHFGRVLRNFNGTCSAAPTQTMHLELPDGSLQTLHASSGLVSTGFSDYLTVGLWKAQCQADGFIAVFSPDGTRYDMKEADDSYWHATRITDRNGNWFAITYRTVANQTRKFVSTVNASDGRSLSFSYFNSRITNIDGGGRSLSYTTNTSTDGGVILERVTPPAGAQWVYTYNGAVSGAGSFLVRTVTNPFGGVVTYTYDFANFMPGIITAPGLTVVKTKQIGFDSWTYAYSPGCPSAGALDTTTVTLPNALGQVIYKHFGYCTPNAGEMWKVGLLSSKQMDGVQTQTYSWDSQVISNESQSRPGYQKFDTQIRRPLLNNLSTVRDGQPYTIDHAHNFDAFGNPQVANESGTQSRQRTFTYFNDATKWILGRPRDENIVGIATISRDYDGNGNLTSLNRFGITTTYRPNPDGSTQFTTDANNFSTIYGSNWSHGIPTSIQQPVGGPITLGNDGFGNVNLYTRDSATWTYTYDQLDRLTRVVYPVHAVATIDWTPTTRTFTRGTYREFTQFDGFGRATSVQRDGVTSTAEYNAMGWKTLQSLPGLSFGTRFTYDILGRLKTEVSAAGTKTYNYEAGATRVTNERGSQSQTVYHFVRFGDPDESYQGNIDSPAGTNIQITRDDFGNLKQATQGSVTRTYTYWPTQLLQSVTEPETGTTTFHRDPAGNISSKVTPAGTVIYGYDGLNRMKSADYGAPTGSTTYTYWPSGKLQDVTNGTAVRHYDYDSNGNLTLDRITVDTQQFAVAYQIDNNDNVSSILYPSQMPATVGTLDLRPDARGRPQSLGSLVSNITYLPSGNLNTITYGNNVVQSFGEMPDRQLPNSVRTSFGINMIYDYDPVGNVSTISGIPNTSGAASLGYDFADRLISASGPWGGGSIQYFGSGDWFSKQIGGDTITATYSGNRLNTVTLNGVPSTYTYDALGNTTFNGRNHFEYDAASNLTLLDRGLSTQTAYGYDGRGWRVWQQKNGAKTYFHHAANGDLLFEFSTVGNQWKQHAYLAGKRVATRASDPAPTTSSIGVETSGVCSIDTTSNVAKFLTASVTSSAPGKPTGTVTFVSNNGEGPSLSGTLDANGFIRLATDVFRPGGYSVVANYAGDGVFAASSSAPVHICIDKTPVTMSIVLNPPSPNAGQTVTATITIAPAGGGSPAGSGTVTGALDSSSVGSQSVGGGVGTLTFGPVNSGAHTLTVQYSGDAAFQPRTDSVSFTVAGPNVSLDSPANGASALAGGQPIVLSATATPIAGRTITSVTFYDGASPLATINAPSAFTYSWPNASAGTHVLSATATDSNGATGASNTATVTVRNAGPTITATGAALNTQAGSSSCTYSSISEDVSGNWTVVCGGGTRTFTISPAIPGSTCPAYSAISEDVNGNWSASCIQ